MSPIVFPTTPIRKDLLMAQATKTRFDKDGVVYVRLRDTWFRIEGEEGNPVAEGFNPNELFTAEQFQAHIKTQAADLSAEPPKQRPSFAIGQVWRMADGQEATVIAYDDYDNTFLLANSDGGYWVRSSGKALSEESIAHAVEYLRETERPRLEVGKAYRTKSGRIVKIVHDDGDLTLPFKDNNEDWYHQFGFSSDGGPDTDIVALVEDEPTKAEQPADEPKQRPAFALGQVWRMSSGQEATVVGYDKRDDTFLLVDDGFRKWFHPDGTAASGSERGFVPVEYLRETENPRIEVGKKYRTKSGKIVKIVEEEGVTVPFLGDNGKWYYCFGFSSEDPLVAIVEEEPAKAEQPAEEPKKNPPLAVGQVWRMRNGEEAMILRNYAPGLFHYTALDGCGNYAPGLFHYTALDGCADIYGSESRIGGDGKFDFVEYLRETDRARIELGREYLRSDGKKVKVVKEIDAGGRFVDDLGCGYHQFSWCNNITLDKELPTPGDEVSYFSQAEDKWLSGWVVRGTNEGGTTTFLIPKEPKEEGHAKFGVATEHVRIEVRSALPPRNIGDLWRRRDGELYAINYYHEQITSLSEDHRPERDLVQYFGKAMAAAGDVQARLAHQDDAISFVKQNSTNERRLTIVKSAQSHGIPSLGPWIVHKILYLPTLALEIE
jgi:hypothetical protein